MTMINIKITIVNLLQKEKKNISTTKNEKQKYESHMMYCYNKIK